MEIADILKIENESERVSKLYEIFNEDKRLLSSNASSLEFLTSVAYINNALKHEDKILDIGAGTGVYSLYFDERGYNVTAIELSEKNIEIFKSKIPQNSHIKLIHGNVLDLSMLEEESFDVVLLFGPLYHLLKKEDRDRAIYQAKRALKKEGKLFVSFINHDFIPYTETQYDKDWFNGNTYDHESFRIDNFPFVFFTLEECREMLQGNNLKIEKEIASDGLSELLAEKINHMEDSSFEQYIKYHFMHCEDIYRLKASNHFLFQCSKE